MRVCVFCGSSHGSMPVYSQAAKTFGLLLAQRGVTLVYGGGNVGLMGDVADAVLAGGGRVIGVIPDFLVRREVAHNGITMLEVVSSMHERKKRMADLSDAFVALPGGWGTLEEFAEVLTWRQLALITQPVGLLNVNRFFDPLLAQMHHMSSQGFLSPDFLKIINIAEKPADLLDLITRA